MIVFLVTSELGGVHVICTATNREYAKSKASQFLGGNPDEYIVSPLTNKGDKVHLDITFIGAINEAVNG